MSPVQGQVRIIEELQRMNSVEYIETYSPKPELIKTRSSNSKNSQHASPKKSPSNTKDNYENVLLASPGEQRKFKRSRTTNNPDTNPDSKNQKVKSSGHSGREGYTNDSTNPMLSQERNPSDSDSPS
jgi:hypothetical protein